jgi:hypothetical protein
LTIPAAPGLTKGDPIRIMIVGWEGLGGWLAGTRG